MGQEGVVLMEWVEKDLGLKYKRAPLDQFYVEASYFRHLV